MAEADLMVRFAAGEPSGVAEVYRDPARIMKPALLVPVWPHKSGERTT